MIRRFLIPILGLLFISIAGAAGAAPVTFNLGNVITGDTPDGTPPWLTATFTSATADSVTLDLTASGLAAGDFLQGGTNGNLGWAFNYSGDAGDLSFLCQSGTCADGIDTGGTTQAQGIIGNFDFVFGWNSNNRFGVGDSASYTISFASGLLDPSDFFLANNKGIFTAAHIQGITGGGSAFVDPGTVVSVPEPAGLGLFLLGLACIAGALGHRRLRGRDTNNIR